MKMIKIMKMMDVNFIITNYFYYLLHFYCFCNFLSQIELNIIVLSIHSEK
jgi:hypothetical protein